MQLHGSKELSPDPTRDGKSRQLSNSLVRLGITVILLASLLLSLSGCKVPKEPSVKEPEIVVNPKLVKTISVDGLIIPSDTVFQSLSPDQSFLLAANTGPEGSKLLLLPVTGEDTEPILVESVSKDWLTDTWFDFRPLGWISDDEFMYAKMGWQPSGDHEGERGACFVIGEVENATGQVSTDEVAFLPLSYYDSSLQILFLPQQGQIYMNNRTTIWRFDISERTLTALKDDLPDYLYRQPIPSPDGKFFVYELNEEERSGIFLFDTDTKKERPLLITGDTISFYPAWSFDGNYIAAYAVERKEDAEGTAWQDYNFFEGEDMPMNIGSSIVIVDTGGNIIDRIEMEDEYLHYFVWAQNQNVLGFLSGYLRDQEQFEEWMYLPVIFDTVWMGKITQDKKVDLVNLGNVPKDDEGDFMQISQIVFDPSCQGMYCNVYGNGTWYFSEHQEPIRIAEGPWTDWVDGKSPVYGGAVVGLADTTQGHKGFFLFEGPKATKFDEVECNWAMVVGFSDQYLAIFAGHSQGEYMSWPESGDLLIYQMLDGAD